MSLDVILNRENDDLFVDLIGDLDISTNKEFKEKVNSVQGVKKIIINCKDLSYVDSTGLGAFVSIYKNLKEQGQDTIIIKNLRQHIKKIFLITDLDKVFAIEE